jgi:pyruvate/2-oxoglutarate dehydrogenase complex dihydrolipoamide acyltransferase (E2) component
MTPFLIEIPMPSMGATVNELTVISIRIKDGDSVARGQKIAELESDKSIFEFEAPCDGTIRRILVAPGDVKAAGAPFLHVETTDDSLRHLETHGTEGRGQKADGSSPQPSAVRSLVWTPRATKMAQEAGLDPSKITDIEATGPGGRVSGDDVTAYLARRKG